jgi:hypothetical protein
VTEGLQGIYLPELFQTLRTFVSIDESDWHTASRYATKWRLSLADALLDMQIVDETSLAKALATTRRLPYLAGSALEIDTYRLTFDSLEDLMNVGALPIQGNKLAICNPYDDHRGLLRPDLSSREMVVTERTPIYDTLHELCMVDWSQQSEMADDQGQSPPRAEDWGA